MKEKAEKPQLSRVSLRLLEPLANVLRKGAEKHAGHKDYLHRGTDMDYVDAALRHLYAISNGKWIDDDGEPHAAHVAANMQILLERRSNAELEALLND